MARIFQQTRTYSVCGIFFSRYNIFLKGECSDCTLVFKSNNALPEWRASMKPIYLWSLDLHKRLFECRYLCSARLPSQIFFCDRPESNKNCKKDRKIGCNQRKCRSIPSLFWVPGFCQHNMHQCQRRTPKNQCVNYRSVQFVQNCATTDTKHYRFMLTLKF